MSAHHGEYLQHDDQDPGRVDRLVSNRDADCQAQAVGFRKTPPGSFFRGANFLTPANIEKKEKGCLWSPTALQCTA